VINSVDQVSDISHRIEVAESGIFIHPFEGDQEDLSLFLERTDRDDLALFAFWIWEGEKASPDTKLVETCLTKTYEQAAATTGAAGMSGL